jgi:hypothetical protein
VTILAIDLIELDRIPPDALVLEAKLRWSLRVTSAGVLRG